MDFSMDVLIESFWKKKKRMSVVAQFPTVVCEDLIGEQLLGNTQWALLFGANIRNKHAA